MHFRDIKMNNTCPEGIFKISFKEKYVLVLEGDYRFY